MVEFQIPKHLVSSFNELFNTKFGNVTVRVEKNVAITTDMMIEVLLQLSDINLNKRTIN